MFTKTGIAGVFFLLVLAIGANGQVILGSLEDVWKYADIHNITIRTVKYELQKSGYATKQSYSAMLPQVNASGSYTDNILLPVTLLPGGVLAGFPNGGAIKFGQEYAYQAGLNAQMNVLNLQNWYTARMNRQTELMNRDSLASTRKLVHQQLATQYYAYLLMLEATRIADQTTSIADSVYQSANHKFAEGTVNQANVDLAQLNLEQAQQTQISSAYQAQIAKNNLKALLGLSLKDSLRLEGSLRNNIPDMSTATFAEDPSLRVALWKTKISLSQYRVSNSAFLPTINILYNYAGQRYDKTFEPFDGATGTAGWFPAQYWSLQATFPLFTSGSRLFQSKRSKIGYEESMAQYENAQKQSVINDENLRLNYEKASAVLKKAEEVMRLSFDNYQHISYKYDEGMSPLDDRLNAFKDYINYQNQYLNSLSDMLVQLYQVKIRAINY